MKNILLSTLIAASIVFVAPQAAYAAKPTPPSGGGSATSSLSGNDISYPQCGTKLPSGQAFAIIGVNGGRADLNNPCFLDQLAWANTSNGLSGQPKVALYVNTTNPGHLSDMWPQNNDQLHGASNPYDTCSGAEDAACAYVYGWMRAEQDATIRNVENPSQYKWWLDVETGNSWSTTDLEANKASLEGMAAYFKSINAAGVGIYSTSYQWSTIVGDTVKSSSPLYAAESWLAGARTERAAKSNCSLPALTAGGKVTVTQFVSKGLDYDISCV